MTIKNIVECDNCQNTLPESQAGDYCGFTTGQSTGVLVLHFCDSCGNKLTVNQAKAVLKLRLEATSRKRTI